MYLELSGVLINGANLAYFSVYQSQYSFSGHFNKLVHHVNRDCGNFPVNRLVLLLKALITKAYVPYPAGWCISIIGWERVRARAFGNVLDKKYMTHKTV